MKKPPTSKKTLTEKKTKSKSSIRIEFGGEREIVTVLYNYPSIGALRLGDNPAYLEEYVDGKVAKKSIVNDPERLLQEALDNTQRKKMKYRNEENDDEAQSVPPMIEQKREKRIRKLAPLGDGFKVLLATSEGFSVNGAKVNVFRDDVLIGQGELEEEGALVFKHIAVPLKKPLRVIVRFPNDQYLEDLDYYVDAGDTALVAQV